MEDKQQLPEDIQEKIDDLCQTDYFDKASMIKGYHLRNDSEVAARYMALVEDKKKLKDKLVLTDAALLELAKENREQQQTIRELLVKLEKVFDRNNQLSKYRADKEEIIELLNKYEQP